MPRFVVLEHDSPRGLHWDFMLERDPLLATWALDQPPDADGPLAAEQLFDHRPDYLDYEGRISGGRGTVTRWDGGTYDLVTRSDRAWTVVLMGRRLIGEAILLRLSGCDSAWEFIFLPIV